MDDRELLELLTRRDERGADELLRRYGPMLRYIIAPILSDPREREECLSDVVLRAWDRAGQYDPARGGFAAWLSAVARNTARNRLRAGGADQETGELDPAAPDPDPGPEELVLREERARRLREVIQRLSGTDRQLFYRKPAICAQPLLILGHGVFPVLLLKGSDTQQPYMQHPGSLLVRVCAAGYSGAGAVDPRRFL